MELEVTTYLNLMVVLVPFLLITAVFSRIAIVELSLPSATGGPSPDAPTFRIEVIVREENLEISNGTSVIAAIQNVEGEYDWQKLSEHMIELKREYSNIEAASVLLEPQVPYDHLIQVMDVVRSAEIPGNSDEEFRRVALFSDISVGEAP